MFDFNVIINGKSGFKATVMPTGKFLGGINSAIQFILYGKSRSFRKVVGNKSATRGQPQLLEHNAMAWIKPLEIPCYEFCPADVEILKLIKNRR